MLRAYPGLGATCEWTGPADCELRSETIIALNRELLSQEEKYNSLLLASPSPTYCHLFFTITPLPSLIIRKERRQFKGYHMITLWSGEEPDVFSKDNRHI